MEKKSQAQLRLEDIEREVISACVAEIQGQSRQFLIRSTSYTGSGNALLFDFYHTRLRLHGGT